MSRIEDSRKGGTDYRYGPIGRLIEAISPIAKERFAFDPASNIIEPVRSSDTPASRPSPVRPESTLPAEMPKVLGNLLKGYAGMHFHQVITGDTTTTVVNERRERLMVNDPVLHTTEVPLPDVNAAIAYQQKQIGRELGQYDERSNSCVDHCVFRRT
ncbi:hypothetical protein L0Z26_22795 [Burkholderia multivorans]|nr:hypothetical protein [Burkholderia multivorans]MCO1344709.1 hypothetical protein [Burkholderia multivorans]MCO1442028.1 hypothetical protein [Burkholderia multivorans]MDR8750569.1 hypothetical protein [Burkholderia multivorans]MDR8809310.1 hypothetical protein [Burkholderia multivorans]UQO28111.1 hypothetical protein L0Z21_14300 [Burkholderia multivorans]